MSTAQLDWSTAEVTDGRLSVELDGDPPKGWASRFEATATLLNRGQWEKVKVKKASIRVSPVVPGDEEQVRHFLESAVLEANAAFESPQDAEDDGAGETEEEPEASAEAEPDADMTARFRGFAASGDVD